MPPKFVYMSRGEERERGKEREKERMSTYECVCGSACMGERECERV